MGRFLVFCHGARLKVTTAYRQLRSTNDSYDALLAELGVCVLISLSLRAGFYQFKFAPSRHGFKLMAAPRSPPGQEDVWLSLLLLFTPR